MNKKQVMLWSLTIWGILCLLHYVIQTALIMREPHEGDLYSYSWGFQALNFAFGYLPFWIVALAVILISEWNYFKEKETK